MSSPALKFVVTRTKRNEVAVTRTDVVGALASAKLSSPALDFAVTRTPIELVCCHPHSLSVSQQTAGTRAARCPLCAGSCTYRHAKYPVTSYSYVLDTASTLARCGAPNVTHRLLPPRTAVAAANGTTSMPAPPWALAKALCTRSSPTTPRVPHWRRRNCSPRDCHWGAGDGKL